MNSLGSYEDCEYIQCPCVVLIWSVVRLKLLLSCHSTASTPNDPDWDDPWNILYGNGTLNYLVLHPKSEFDGNYEWVSNITEGRQSAHLQFPNAEGIDVSGNELFFVSKRYASLYILDLDSNTYRKQTTKRGLFEGNPDTLMRIVGADNEILYFTEDGGQYAGVHGRNGKGQYYTILESHEYADETTGLAFSPDAKHMYIAYQDNGLLFDITRKDGLPFGGKTLNVKYHNMPVG
jgi:hypothetical protein